MGVRVKGNMFCARCNAPVQAVKQGHGFRNSIGAVWTLGLSIEVEPWVCPTCGAECSPYSSPSVSSGPSKSAARKAAGGAKVEWRCEKNGHLLDRRRKHCPIDNSPAVWRTKASA